MTQEEFLEELEAQADTHGISKMRLYLEGDDTPLYITDVQYSDNEIIVKVSP